jgi:2-aminoadipate transaminase
MSVTIPLTPQELLPTATPAVELSAIQELLPAVSRPEITSFALGLPAPDLFPRKELAHAAAQILETDARALQYGPPSQRLKTHIVELMQQRDVSCREEQIFLTNGAQQGINLLAHLYLESGGQALCEERIYPGFQQVIAPFHPAILTVPTDLSTGMDVDAVESALARGARPAFIYAIADGHNPIGASMSLAKRTRLVELARHYRVRIIEDDPYGLLYYDLPHPPPLRALDDEWVLYVGSFSKILAPGLRVGWAIVPEALVPKLSVLKEASDLDVATFSQRLLTTYLDAGFLPEHVERLRREYRVRRDAMDNALRIHFPSEARWVKPSSGLFFWVELPRRVDTRELLHVALETEQVAFLPGQAFCIGAKGDASHCMRLNFSNRPPADIDQGIARLGRAIQRFL